MKIDRGDITGFVVGILTSVIANYIWEVYRAKKKKLEYSDKKIIEEVNGQINGLKKHIDDNFS
jgi:lysophospholipid acyltransferase (LPLAT)-like uncharacterized protein